MVTNEEDRWATRDASFSANLTVRRLKIKEVVPTRKHSSDRRTRILPLDD
jgi:hypothetical protein